MMALLKRFEEESAEDENLLLDDDLEEEEDPESDLARQFQDIDLGKDARPFSALPCLPCYSENTTADAIWSMLTPDQRSKFIAALGNPTSELVQDLLASEDMQAEIREPWWEAPGDAENSSDKRYGKNPDMLDLPVSMITPPPRGPSLVYNVCAVLYVVASYISDAN